MGGEGSNQAGAQLMRPISLSDECLDDLDTDLERDFEGEYGSELGRRRGLKAHPESFFDLFDEEIEEDEDSQLFEDDYE